MTEPLNEIPLAKLNDSPFQPRTTYTKLEELAESIRAMGILQPLVVRPAKGSAYEIVAGHRRKRGAEMVGLKKVPAIVREMTDAEAQEAILVENGQREDLSILEELDVYLALRMGGLEVAEIAARIGRPEGHVYRRLQLERLVDAGREVLADDQLPVAAIEMIARLEPKTQERALKSLAGDQYNRPATVAQTKRWIEQNGTLTIGDAPFDPEDAGLVEGAPACSACPKNSAGTMLFADLESAQCFDDACWKQKSDAAWEKRAEAAAAKGITVLEGDAAKEPFTEYGSIQKAWVDLRESVWVDGKRKTLKSQIGKARLADAKVYLVRARNGAEYELMKRNDMKKILAAAPKKGDPEHLTAAKPPHLLKEEKAARIFREFHKTLLTRVAIQLDEAPWPGGRELWTAIALGQIARSWAATVSAAEKRRKIAIKTPKGEPSKHPEKTPTDWLVSWVLGRRDAAVPHGDEDKREKATVADLQLLVIELLTAPDLDKRWDQGFPPHSEFMGALFGNAVFGIDLEEVWRGAAKAVEAKRSPASEKPSKEHAKNDRAAKTTKKANGKAKPAPAPAPAEDTSARILELYEQGKSYREIAKEVGLTKDSVARRIKKLADAGARA